MGSTRKTLTFNPDWASKLILSIAAAALVSAGCVHKTKALRKQVSRYEGDGIITDASLAVFPIARSPGFRISFPGFDPKKDCEREYTFRGVPKIKHYASAICVRFPGPYSPDLDEIKKRVTSVLSYSISDEAGNVLTNQNVTFSNAWWSWSGGRGAGVFGLWVERPGQYGMQNSFYFEPTNRYTLRIKYEPGSAPPQTTNMFILIENGGHI